MVDAERVFNEELGARIRNLRRDRGLSQATVADYIRVPRTSVILIERGRQGIAAHALVLLCEIFKVRPDELLYGDQSPAATAADLPVAAPAAVREFVSTVREAATHSPRRRP